MLKLRTLISKRLVDHCIERSIENTALILNGKVTEFDSLIDDAQEASGWPIAAVKEFCRKYLYTSRVVRQRELTAYQVITGLLDKFQCLLITCDRSRFANLLNGDSQSDCDGEIISIEASLVSLLPEKYINAYKHALLDVDAISNPDSVENRVREKIARIHLVLDYISGMTDAFALSTYQLLHGMKTHV